MEPITTDTPCFFTQQLFLIGTQNADGSPHFAPISWISFTGGPPCCLVISIDGNTRKKQTALNIERTGLLSATVVTADMLPYVEQHNDATMRQGANAAWDVLPGNTLDVPLLRDAVWSYECEVIQTVPIGGCTTYFAAFRQVNVRQDIQALDFIDLRKVDPVIYAPWHYFTVGRHLGQIGDFAL